MTIMERRHLMNFGISMGKYSSFINNIILLASQRASSNVCVANVHMFIEAYQDKSLNKIINTADIVTPDGMPLAWGLRLLLGVKQDRVAGMDLLPDLLQQLTLHKLPVFFYGGTPELLQITELFLIRKYPLLNISGLYSPPFRELTREEEQQVVNKINSSGASVVFVVLGCPKQEKWMASMKGRINAVMIGVGGALPVMVGIQKRAPRWMQKLGLEWFFRLIQEPNRLLKRYVITNSLFLYLMTKEYLAIRLFRKEVQ